MCSGKEREDPFFGSQTCVLQHPRPAYRALSYLADAARIDNDTSHNGGVETCKGEQRARQVVLIDRVRLKGDHVRIRLQ